MYKKNFFKDNIFLFKISIVAIIIMILDHYFPHTIKDIIYIILIFIFVYILIVLLYKLIIKKIIRNIKIKKVNNKELKVLNEYLNYNFNKKILEDNEIIDYIKFVKCLIYDFKEMEKNIHYTKNEMNNDLKEIEKNKDKKVKEYIDKSKEIFNIIYNYYDENGIRKI